jgi:Tfp pilus assembly protein PilF
LSDFLIKEKNYEDLFRLLTPVIMNRSITKENKIAFFAELIENNDLLEKQGEKLSVSLMVLEASYPGDDVIQILRPELLLRLKNSDFAIKRLEEIVTTNQGNYYAWEKLLLAYLDVKDFENLQSKGAVCASMFNRSFLAKVLYATGATENKDYNTALAELDKARILAGSDKDMLMQVLSVKADVYYRLKDLDKAFGTFEEALKINNEDMTILNNYAYYLAEQNLNLKEAENMSKRVIEKESRNTTFLDTYAWVLYQRGKLKEAAKIMETIISSGEEPDAEWFEHYGYILKKRKNCSGAIENWNVAIKIDGTKTELLKEIENCKK